MPKTKKQLTDSQLILKTAMNYLLSQDFSERNIYRKLITLKQRYPQSDRYKKYTPKLILEVIDYLKKHNYLNEERTIKNYIESSLSSTQGLRMVIMKLKRRGFKNIYIDKVVNEIKESGEPRNLERITKVALRKKGSLERKYASVPTKMREIKPRLFQFLASRGFNSSEINKIIERLYSKL